MSLLRAKLKMKNAKVQTGETGQRGTAAERVHSIPGNK
jgi:hypothetical protein